MDKVKRVLTAFVVGGLFAMLGQVFMLVFAAMLGGDSPLVGPLALIALGLLGGILFIFGIYQKIEKFASYGAILPFSGLAAAVAGVYEGAKEQTGSTGAALKTAVVSLVLYVVGIGTILSVIVGVVAFYTV